MRLPPQPWLCSTIGTGRSFVAPAGRKSVKQMSTGAVVPGSGTLWMQPSVVVTSAAVAGAPRNGSVAAVSALTTSGGDETVHGGASRVTTVTSTNE